ncbi:RCC1-like G exchanging factor-like protein [Brevipalpus obovatus]|uniref:RCC1-like G exchanging factor-like protein n=1 Tax=Brevipalpus obovatus TaxID=246614 RepID=UPI003D9EF4F2
MSRFRKTVTRSFLPKKIDIREMPVYQYVPDSGLKVHDRIYTWGLAATGALGFPALLDPKIGKQRDLWPSPRKMRFFHSFKIRDVACGYGFTVFAANHSSTSFSLFGTGINTNNQLGCQLDVVKDASLAVVTAPSPIRIPQLFRDCKFTQVACGRCHTVVLSDHRDGAVFSMGNNSFGQCGRPIVSDEVQQRHLPIIEEIKNIEGKIAKIVCGQDHTLFLTENGQVYACGMGSDGQTGLGHYKNTGIPELVKGDIEGEKIVDISSSVDATLACNDKGDLFGWGNSEYLQFNSVTDDCQLNIPRRLPISEGKVIKVAAGGTACGFVNDKGQVFVWGYGMLGQGPKVEYLKKPSLIPDPLFGKNEVTPDIHVTNLYASTGHWAAINNKGELFTWGKNRNGVLGLPDKRDRFFPFRVILPIFVKKVSLGPDHSALIGRSLV